VISEGLEPAVWLSALPFLLGAATLTWLLSLGLRNVSLVEPVWALLLFMAGVIYALDADPRAPRLSMVLWPLALWTLRRTFSARARRAGQRELPSHRRLRERHEPGFAMKSLYLVFWCRAGLAWLVSLPLLGAFASTAPLGWLDYGGLALWLLGFAFETSGDWQLGRFRKDPANAGGVLDRGLWRFTRRPDYFGTACVWWGFSLMAVSAGAWWSVLGPALLSALLMHAARRPAVLGDGGKTPPRYADYVLKTNAFFPGPPRK
jgi:steroid 5-alpha reductase family enzyme